MAYTNVEIKARTSNTAAIRKFLLDQSADFVGTDFQTDTYFEVPNGRLKLREGNIENNLIFYHRENTAGPRPSTFTMYPVNDPGLLKQLLTASLGIKVVVIKEREIYYIGNVKFHLDTLRSLGNFVEIEAGNKIRPLSLDILHEQCKYYKEAFGIADSDLVHISYSDMLISTPNDRF